MPTQAYYRAHRAKLAEQERARTYLRAGRSVPPKKATGRPPLDGSRPLVVRARVGVGRDKVANDVPAIERCELVDEAIAKLRSYERFELGHEGPGIRRSNGSHIWPMDSIGRDLVGAYVLAKIAGEDPDEAIRRERARYGRDRKALVFGTAMVDGLTR